MPVALMATVQILVTGKMNCIMKATNTWTKRVSKPMPNVSTSITRSKPKAPTMERAMSRTVTTLVMAAGFASAAVLLTSCADTPEKPRHATESVRPDPITKEEKALAVCGDAVMDIASDPNTTSLHRMKAYRETSSLYTVVGYASTEFPNEGDFFCIVELRGDEMTATADFVPTEEWSTE